MSNISSKSNILAHWQYEPDLWRDFLEYESTVYKGSVRATKHLFLVVLILTIVIVFLTLFITLILTDRWDLDMLGPSVAFAFLGGFFLMLTGAFWLYRLERWKQLNERTGEVVISLNGVKTNGMNFDWDFREYGLRFKKIERKTISVSPGKNCEILEFYTLNYFSTSDGRTREYFELRVPIPFGKEAEAETIISRLNARLLSAEQEWIQANSALGHDFSLGVCRKCGDTIAEAACFRKLKCGG